MMIKGAYEATEPGARQHGRHGVYGSRDTGPSWGPHVGGGQAIHALAYKQKKTGVQVPGG